MQVSKVISLAILTACLFVSKGQASVAYNTDWNAVLDRGLVHDVFVNSTATHAAILEGPTKPSRSHVAGPRFTLEVSNFSFRLSALTLDPRFGFSDGSWGNSLTLRDSTVGQERKIATPADSLIGHITWSPGEKWVSFIAKEGEASYLWVASVLDGSSFRVSDFPVNLMVAGQATSSLQHPNAGIAYVWLPDESGIVFAKKDTRKSLSVEEWSTLTIPVTGDTRYQEQSHPAMHYFEAESDLARQVAIENAYSRDLIVAPIDVSKPPRSTKLPHGITHLLRRTTGLEVAVGTVGLSSAGDDVREAMIVSIDNEKPRIKARVIIPDSANWHLYSTDSPDDVAIALLDRDGRSCFRRLTERDMGNENQVCFERPIHSMAQDATSLVLLNANREVFKISKHDLSVEGPVDLAEPQSDVMYLLQPPDDNCSSAWAPLVVSVTLSARRNRILSHSMAEVSFQDGESFELLGFSEQDAAILPTSRATCDGKAIVSRESRNEPKNYQIFDAVTRKSQQITDFDDVMPEFITWERVNLDYFRSDSIPLSADLIIPPSSKRMINGKYPAIVWQYPIRVENRDDWAEYKKSRRGPSGSYRALAASNEYSRPLTEDYIGRWLPNLLALDGYAVIHYPDFPLVGVDGNAEFGPYAIQLRRNSEALIAAMRKTGIIDESRIAISGHSRGGATASLLLAETNIFAAGFAYAAPSSFNSHLNGFQYEDRSFWEYPEAYLSNAPIFSVDRIDEPLLSMYGEQDNLPTREQGLDLHSLLIELGGVSKLIVYPDEKHNPAFRETQQSILEEVSAWLQEHLVLDGTSN